MRNQRSWRLLTEIEPNDSNIQVSKVIWKVDENWQPFYPIFSGESTVVLMSDDKKTFETCKATADGTGNMVLTKRWLSDDVSETEVASFKRDWLPWTYMFATMWAGDLISLNEDNIWKWDQTYQWDLIVEWNFDVSWNFNMDTDWDVEFKTPTGDMTFQDKNVWPITLSQMIQPPLSWSAIEVMSEDDWEEVETPALNTAYMRYKTWDTKISKMYFNGSDYDLWDNRYDWDWKTKTIVNWEVELWLRTVVDTPTSNFTLVAPNDLVDWAWYAIRIINETSYTMTLWEWFTNPRNVSLTLSGNATDQFTFLCIDWNLELQPEVTIQN